MHNQPVGQHDAADEFRRIAAILNAIQSRSRIRFRHRRRKVRLLEPLLIWRDRTGEVFLVGDQVACDECHIVRRLCVSIWEMTEFEELGWRFTPAPNFDPSDFENVIGAVSPSALESDWMDIEE